jgi:hypothetical protein
LVLVVRCRRGESLRYARESCSVRAPEVRRYREAGRPTCRYINPRDHVREWRIEQEIVVDAYDPQGYQCDTGGRARPCGSGRGAGRSQLVQHLGHRMVLLTHPAQCQPRLGKGPAGGLPHVSRTARPSARQDPAITWQENTTGYHRGKQMV